MGLILAIETVYTPEIWITLLIPILLIILFMMIKKPRIKEVEEDQEVVYKNEIYNQIVESEQNLFM